MNWYLDCIKNKYFCFDGRARRTEFWMFVLFNFIAGFVLGILGGMIFGMESASANLLSSLYSLAVLLPGLGVAVRRLHDIGKSGWWILICLVPFVGWIVLLIFYVMDSQPGANQYGPNPKGA